MSHVLSARLSRHPLAWSEHCIRQMVMLRVYAKNGGVVSAQDIRVSRNTKQLDEDKNAHRIGFAKNRAYADQQMDDCVKCKPDWRLFEIPSSHYGKLDGSSILPKALGRCRAFAASA